MKTIAMAILALVGLAGCADESRARCISDVHRSYCRPYESRRDGYTYLEYDCSGVSSAAYDAAIKACIEAKK